MKLSLLPALRTALYSCYALSLSTISTGSLFTGTVAFTLIASEQAQATEYPVTDSSTASSATSSTEDDTITINLVHDSSATKNDNYLPNATTSDVSYTADTITIEQMDISNGYGSGLSSSNHACYYFNATILGDGDINFYNWSSTSCYQEYIFTGDLSEYSGDITSGKADNVTAATYSGGLYLTFSGTSSDVAASGTGSITLAGSSGECITYAYEDSATIANESITATTINLGLSSSYDYANYTLDSNITVGTLNILMTNKAYVASGGTLNVTSLVFGNNTSLTNYGTVNLSGTVTATMYQSIYNYGEFNALSGGKLTGYVANYEGGVLTLASGSSSSYWLVNYGEMNLQSGSNVTGTLKNMSGGTLNLGEGFALTASSSLTLSLDGTIAITDQSQILVSSSSAISLSSSVIFDLRSATDEWVLSDGVYTFQLIGDSAGNYSYDISSLTTDNFIGLNDFGNYTFNSDGSITFDLGDVSILRYTGDSSFNWGTNESDVLFTNSATGAAQSFSNGVALSIEVDTHATLTSSVSTNMISIDEVEFTLTGNGNQLTALQIVFAGDSSLILTDDALSSDSSIGTGSNSAGTVQFSASDSSTVFNYGEQLKSFGGQVVLENGTLQLSASTSDSLFFSNLTVNGGTLISSATLDMGDIVLNDGTSTFTGNITADSLSTTGGTSSLNGNITLGSLNYGGGSLELGGTIALSSMSLSSAGTITLSKDTSLSLADSSASWIKLDYKLTFSLGDGATMDIDETIWTRGNITFSLTDSSDASASATIDMNQLLVGYSTGSSLVTIGEGVTLIISGSTLESSGTASSFIVGGQSEGGNVDVYGSLVLNSGIMNYAGDGAIAVKDGGTIVLNAGLAAEVAGTSLTMNIESGATLSLGNQEDSSVDYGSVMSINIMNGATITDNGMDATTTLNATLNYESGASINLASSGEGKTLLIGMNLSGNSISANIQGEGLVEIAAGAALTNLSVEANATLNLSSNVTATTTTIAAGAVVEVNTALNLGTSASITNEGTLMLNEGSSLTISEGSSLNLSGSISVTEAGQIINDGTLSLSDDFVFDLSSLLDSAWDYDITTGIYSLTLIAGTESYDLSNFDITKNLTGLDTSNIDVSFNSDGTLSHILSNLTYQRGGELTLQIGSSMSNVDGSTEVLYTDSASIYFTTADSQVTLGENIFSLLWEIYDVEVQLTGNNNLLVTDNITLNGSAKLTLTDDVLHSDVRLYQATDSDSELIITLSDSSSTLNYAKQLSEYTGDITITSGTLNLTSTDVAGYSFDVITIEGGHLLMSGTSTASDLVMSSGGTITLADGASLTTGGGAVGDSSDAFKDNLVKHTGDITINLGSGALLDQNIRMWLDTGVSLTLNATNSDADSSTATYRINELLLRYTSTGDSDTETSVTISSGTELEITGTNTTDSDANSSFIISGYSTGTSLITVEGQLTINSGIVSLGGSSNVINVASGGVFQANAGLVAYDSSDSAVEIELNMASGSTLLLGNQITTDDHSDAISVNMASGTTIGTNGIDEEVYVYQSINYTNGGSYTFDVAADSSLNMMQSINLSNSTITVKGDGSTNFQSGLSVNQIIVQESGTAGLGGTSSLTQIIGGSNGGNVQVLYAEDGSSQLNIGSASYQANVEDTAGTIAVEEGGSLTESTANKISTTGITINLESDMQLTESTLGKNTVVNLAEDATLNVGDNITITSANSEGASIDVSSIYSSYVTTLSDDTLSCVTFDNANVVLTSDSDENSLTVQRIYTSSTSQLTITSGSNISISTFSYLYGTTVIESGAQVTLSGGIYIYNDFYIGENAYVSLSGNLNTGTSVYLSEGAHLDMTSVGLYSYTTLNLDGGTLTMNDNSRWVYSDIIISNSGNAMTGTTTTLTFANEISYTNAWVGSEDWTLNLDGNTKITINSAFTIDFTVDGEATLDVGSYVIFSNVANDVSSSLSASDVFGVVSDEYELVWSYEDGNIVLSVIDLNELIWDTENEQWVNGVGTVVEPSSGNALSFETDSISAGQATLSDDLDATVISITGESDVTIAGDVSLSSQSDITKTGAGTATVEAQLSAANGIAVEEGSIALTKTGSITSDTSVADGASVEAGAITITGTDAGTQIDVDESGSISADKVEGTTIQFADIGVDGNGVISNTAILNSTLKITAGSTLVLEAVHLSTDCDISSVTSFLRSSTSTNVALSFTGENIIDASVEAGSLSIEGNTYTLHTLDEVSSVSMEGSLTINIILSEEELSDFTNAYNLSEGITFMIAENIASYDLVELTINIGTWDSDFVLSQSLNFGEGDYSNGILTANLFGGVIPEPSTGILSTLALLGLLGRRKRKE